LRALRPPPLTEVAGRSYPQTPEQDTVRATLTRTKVHVLAHGRGIADAIGRGMPRTVFVDEAAGLLGVSRRTVYYRIREGKLRTIRTACGSQRVTLESIERLLREEVGLVIVPAAGVSDTGLSSKSPAT